MNAKRLKQLSKRAETLRDKASQVFNELRAAYGPDHNLVHLAGDTMCSAAELRATLRGEALVVEC